MDKHFTMREAAKFPPMIVHVPIYIRGSVFGAVYLVHFQKKEREKKKNKKLLTSFYTRILLQSYSVCPIGVQPETFPIAH